MHNHYAFKNTLANPTEIQILMPAIARVKINSISSSQIQSFLRSLNTIQLHTDISYANLIQLPVR